MIMIGGGLCCAALRCVVRCVALLGSVASRLLRVLLAMQLPAVCMLPELHRYLFHAIAVMQIACVALLLPAAAARHLLMHCGVLRCSCSTCDQATNSVLLLLLLLPPGCAAAVVSYPAGHAAADHPAAQGGTVRDPCSVIHVL
jgi:hypothetical protein